MPNKFTIQKIDFKRSASRNIDLSDASNIDKIVRHVLPVICENEGWGTGELTTEKFLANPEAWQLEMNATLMSNVHIAYDQGGQPAGIWEHTVTDVSTDSKLGRALERILSPTHREIWHNWPVLQPLVDTIYEKSEEILDTIRKQPLYSGTGAVVRPDLQGKGTGLIQQMFAIISDGIAYGWTSNPVVVRLQRKMAKNTFFFPLLELEEQESTEFLAAICIVAAGIYNHPKEQWQELDFGALYSKYFVEERSDKYIRIAENMHSAGKLSQQDLSRLRYVIGRKQCAGALVSFPN